VGVASPYGPLWQLAGTVIARLAGHDVTANVVAMKAFTMACYLSGMPLIHRSLMRLEPAHALRGLLFYAWCPAAMLEFGSSGHNDALLVFCLVVAAYLLVTRRPGWAIVAVMAASLVKFSPLVILPFFLVAAWRMPASRRGRLAAVLGGGLGAAGLTAILYAPFGVDGFRATVSALFGRGDLRANSLASTLSGVARESLGMPEARVAQWIVRAGLALVAVVLLVRLAKLVLPGRVPASDVPREVLRSGFLLLLVLLVTAVPFFWPWYVLWLVAFVPLLSERGPAAVFVAFACGAFAIPLTTAYYGQLFSRGFQPAMALLVFGPVVVTGASILASRQLRLGGPRPAPRC
jgi:hypothetical protein